LPPGRTYTLTDKSGDASRYYRLVRDVTRELLQVVPGEIALREKVRSISSWKGLFGFFSSHQGRARTILDELDKALTPFLTGIDEHLGNLTITERLDKTIRTTREQYLLYMLEIELTNRINRKQFSVAPWRMALIAHCLRDFRKGCRSSRGDIEDLCKHCDMECYVNLGAKLLERYQIHPFISVSMDHGRLFKKLKGAHPDMGVLGIACIPELVMGMRLCEGLHIPAVGIPLDANRCSRWLGECLETTFSLEELERLVSPVPGARDQVPGTKY